jgi:hypothetical protein
MATPLLAGAVALLREYFMAGRQVDGSPNASAAFTPSGALIRALLMVSSTQLDGSWPPTVEEGWGAVSLVHVLRTHPATRASVGDIAGELPADRAVLLRDERGGLAPGGFHTLLLLAHKNTTLRAVRPMRFEKRDEHASTQALGLHLHLPAIPWC